MILHHNNQIEALVSSLAEVVARPREIPDPIAPELIVVQSRGMERWLSIELSRRLGVWANPSFPFPRRLVQQIVEVVLEGAPAAADPSSPLPISEPETCMWSIAALLPGMLERAGFEPLRRYLEDDPDSRRRIQLSRRIAEVFDDYLTYRPEMILAWERGESGAEFWAHSVLSLPQAPDREPVQLSLLGEGPSVPVVASRGLGAGDAWQPELWRELVARHGSDHPARRTREAIDRLGSLPPGSGSLSGLPGRVSVFGVTALSPLYVDLLAALSRHVEVHVFVFACARREGNPLWTSLGSVPREFREVLESRGFSFDAFSDTQLSDEPGGLGDGQDLSVVGGSALRRLQRDILEGRGASPTGDAMLLDPADQSLAVHACHAPMREVEVLHDQLVALFEADPTLEPRDVIVMTPRIEDYAPLIEAVFSRGAAGGEGVSDGAVARPRVPFRIADRRIRATHEVVDALAATLDALTGRLTATAVMDLLLIERVRERFGIRADELEQIRDWILGAGIRWGVDADHRASVGQPEFDANTWKHGLQRLLLGLAMPSGARTLFGLRLPAPDVEPRAADLLGRLLELCETIFRLQQDLVGPRGLSVWRENLGALLEGMIARNDETAPQHAAVQHALASLALRADSAGWQEPVPLAAVRSELDRSLERSLPAYDFLSGGVTFCEMVPMRTIPFRVVVLLGMNEDAFPRSREPIGFDLISRKRRAGDRSVREDDRNLFLEALLSARERVIITYVGQSARDGRVRAPSVVVSEVLDYARDAFAVPTATAGGSIQAQDPIRARLVALHPLQAFSPRNFGADPDPRLFSHAGGSFDAAVALQRVQREPAAGSPFVLRETESFSPELGPPELGPAARPELEVDIDSLAAFFSHPVRAFLRRRLGLYLREEARALEDREPMEVDPLQRWQLTDALLRDELAGVSAADAIKLARAGGGLPLGWAGDIAGESLLAGSAAIREQVVMLRAGAALPDLRVEAEQAGVAIHGVLGDLWPGGRVEYTPSKLPNRREMGFWVRHVVLCFLRPEGVPLESHLVARATNGVKVISLAPLPDAEVRLRDLIAIWRSGLLAPLPFFFKSSCEYAATEGSSSARRLAALKQWEGDRFPECEDDDHLQAFRDIDPTDPAFEAPGGHTFADLAERVCGPYLQAQVEAQVQEKAPR